MPSMFSAEREEGEVFAGGMVERVEDEVWVEFGCWVLWMVF